MREKERRREKKEREIYKNREKDRYRERKER